MISHPMDYTSFFLRFVFYHFLNDVKFTFLVVCPPFSFSCPYAYPFTPMVVLKR